MAQLILGMHCVSVKLKGRRLMYDQLLFRD